MTTIMQIIIIITLAIIKIQFNYFIICPLSVCLILSLTLCVKSNGFVVSMSSLESVHVISKQAKQKSQFSPPTQCVCMGGSACPNAESI